MTILDLRPPRPHQALGLVALGLASCATYNERTAAPLAQFERGEFASARAGFLDRAGAPFLEGAEAGMAAFLDADFDGALEHFDMAVLASKDAEERALLGVSNLSETLLTLTVNESQSEYEGEGFERVMVHAMLGLCYLAKGRADAVLVEARRIDELLTGEEQLYEKEYRAGGLGHLLSAIAYELVGKPNDALIDYERMREKDLGGDLVERAIERLDPDRRSGLAGEEYEQYVRDRKRPSIVVIAGLGMGPWKHEHTLRVPTDGGVFAVSVPSFEGGHAPTDTLELVFPEASTAVRTSVVENVADVARENLEDRIAMLSARSVARGLFKRQLADQLRDNEDGAILGAAVDIFTIATERADLRAWRTLPRTWVAARAFVPADEPVLVELREVGGDAVRLGRFRLVEGETMFVLARALDSGLVAHVVGGEHVEITSTEPDPEAGADARQDP